LIFFLINSLNKTEMTHQGVATLCLRNMDLHYKICRSQINAFEFLFFGQGDASIWSLKQHAVWLRISAKCLNQTCIDSDCNQASARAFETLWVTKNKR